MELAGSAPADEDRLQPPLPRRASVHDLVGAFAGKLPHKSFVSELLRRQLELLQARNVRGVPPGATSRRRRLGQFADLIRIFRLGFPSPSTLPLQRRLCRPQRLRRR